MLERTLGERSALEKVLGELDFPQRFTSTSQLRNVPLCQKEKAPFCRAFREPSDGLEPPTPSLP
jgi:hypothetical protein